MTVIDKKTLLNDFLIKHNNLPKQGTQEWLDGRTYRIGGSEISTVLGKNKYQKKKDLVKSHIGLKPFISFFAVHWGSLFEDALRDYINIIYKCDIIETGSIPHKELNTIAYSPDGIAVTNTNNISHLLNETDIKDKDSIVLFEFKCPYSRIPTGEVPEHYIDQPLLGMEVIDICDISIFIEAVYKLTPFINLKYDNIYNINYHKDKELLTKDPITYGSLILYYKKPKEKKEMSLDELLSDDLNEKNLLNEILQKLNDINYNIKLTIKDKEIYDLGSINEKYIINKILAGCSDKHSKCFEVDYTNQYIYDKEIFKEEDKFIKKYNDINTLLNIKDGIYKKMIELENEGNIIFGILPYKLFDIFINPIKKKKILTDNVITDIDNIINIIKLCDNKTVKEKINIINQHF